MTKKNTSTPNTPAKPTPAKPISDGTFNSTGKRSFTTEHIASRISVKPKPNDSNSGNS